MKASFFLKSMTCVRLVVVAGVCGGGVSCSLPPKEAWQRMKEDGVLKAFFVPKRAGVVEDRTQRLAGADLTVDPEVKRVPTAEPGPQAGYVYSPRTTTRKLVNVKDFAAGETVLCPYTMEPFIVPGRTERVARVGLAETGGTKSGAVASRAGSAGGSMRELGVADNPAVVEVTPDSGLTAEAGGWDAGSPAASGPHAGDTPQSPVVEEVPSTMAPAGLWVEGKPGHVYSPFAERHQLVDVTGIPPGTEVECPFTHRIFRVPEGVVVPNSLAGTLPEPTSEAGAAVEVAASAEMGAGEAGSAASATSASEGDAAILRELAGAPAPGGEISSDPAAATAPGAPKYGATGPAGAPPSVAPVAPVTAEAPAAPKEAPKTKGSAKPAPPLATAAWVDGKPGLVQSPYGKPGELVDVTGKPSGSKVVCPYTNKPFLVPKP